jgi:ABC-2 type transport system ATP-binding protein
MSAIAVERLQKTWAPFLGPRQTALNGLTLSIPKGAAFGLIGPNGAGKTTFIKVLLGICRPDSGQVQVLGGDPQDASVRARIGYLPERLHLPAALTALGFLRSMATLKGLKLATPELLALLDRVGLKADKQRLGEYSKGMRQRLGLAAALLGQPELLILDEPTDGIDPVGRVEVRRLLVAERDRGATLLLNSHLLSETERVCDRIGVLDHGQLKLTGTIEEVRQSARAWDVTFGPGAPVEALTAQGFIASGHHFRLEAPTLEVLNAALDAARAAGALVAEVRPAARDLEQVLADVLEGEP